MGVQVVFCSDNTLSPLLHSWLLKKLPGLLTNGVLNLVLGYRIFCLCTIFLFLHTLVSFLALFGERFPVLSLLYSRTLRLSYVEP